MDIAKPMEHAISDEIGSCVKEKSGKHLFTFRRWQRCRFVASFSGSKRKRDIVVVQCLWHLGRIRSSLYHSPLIKLRKETWLMKTNRSSNASVFSHQDCVKCLSEFASNPLFPDVSMEAIRLESLFIH